MDTTAITRKSFVVGTGALGAIAAAAPAVLVNPALADEATTRSATSWRMAPEPVPADQIVQTLEADVVVCGASHAGAAAARAAAEAGASVILVEKQDGDEYMGQGNDIGHINSEYLASQGVPKVDENEFFTNWMVNAGNRANADLVRSFVRNCGAAFDWWLEPLPEDGVASINVDFWPETPNTLHELNTGYKYWIGTPQLYGTLADGTAFDMTAAYRVIHQYLADEGVDIHFNCEAQQLVQDANGRVTGVVAMNADGSYVQFSAKKGVILATGDFSGNMEMCEDLLQSQLSALEEGEEMFGLGRDGRGIQMAVWAGGRLEPTPMPILGDFDSAVPSKYQALWLDVDCKRFMNECVGDYVQTGFANVRHKHGNRYIVFDSSITESLTYNVPAHAAFDPTEDGAIEGFQAQLDEAYAAGASGYEQERGGTVFAADDLDTLVSYVGLTDEQAANFKASVERYNEVCNAGIDDDYGKDPRLLFPVAEPPFYAVVTTQGRLGTMLSTNGGVETTADQQVLDMARNPIPGLYATGNCCGLRFGPAYFTPVAGVSIGIAITLGREVGKTVAAL